ncbi:hypothetical protein KC725_05435 [Candidatus Peregrinibacteria bacterium]|nr:hypothetical protein [Candidatus Peregrinibacteria bacterium]
MISSFDNLIIMNGHRKVDRTGEDWDDATQTEGLTKRIKFTGEGEEIKLRPGTEDVVADPKRGISWSSIVQMMVKTGVAAVTDEENVFIKTAEGLAGHDSLQDIIDQDIKENISSLNPDDSEQGKTFIELWVRERFTKLHGEISDSSYKKVLEMLPSIADGLMKDIHTTQNIQVSIAHRVVSILEDLNSGEIDQKEYQKLYQFFVTLGETKDAIADQKSRFQQ